MRTLNANELAFVSGGQMMDLGGGFTAALELVSPPRPGVGQAGGVTLTIGGGITNSSNVSNPGAVNSSPYASIQLTGNDVGHMAQQAINALVDLHNRGVAFLADVLNAIGSFLEWVFGAITSFLDPVGDPSHVVPP